MSVVTISEIEESIFALPTKDQRKLIDRVNRALRLHERAGLDEELKMMANDPDIRREISEIDKEFRCTEMDGLGQ